MGLFKPHLDSDKYTLALGIIIMECDICGRRFSSSMEWAWPFCSAGIPHELMESGEQIRRQKLLAETPEKATASFVEPILKLYPPSQLEMCWEENALPNIDTTPLQDVRLPKDRFKNWANNYLIAGHFIGKVIGKHNWAIVDIIDYARKHWGIEINNYLNHPQP